VNAISDAERIAEDIAGILAKLAKLQAENAALREVVRDYLNYCPAKYFGLLTDLEDRAKALLAMQPEKA
jgi:hypothetical protein